MMAIPRLFEQLRLLLGKKSVRQLERLERQLEEDVSVVRRRMGRLAGELRSLDLDRVKNEFKDYEALQSTLADEQQNQSRDFKELEARCKVYRELIAEGRAALLDVQLNQGRRWDLDVLSQSMTNRAHSAQHYQMFRKLLDVGQLRGAQVDLAQLDWIIMQNKQAQTHLNVAIEGAGPTGLTLAFTQFQSGANVSVFEKRSTQYNRVQVVRLDPKWMDMLKFYLGEHYYDMFGQDGQAGKGIVRADGFGEIVTHRLEEGLNHRFTELMGRNYTHTSQSNDPRKTRLERLAAYEMTGVEESELGYTVQAKYNPEYDSSPFANGKKNPPAGFQKPKAFLSRPVDLVICAGGKSSQLRNRYMKDKPVTVARSYGVCSWEGPKDHCIQNDRLDTFPDFRGMVVLDQQFQQFFQGQMEFQVDRIEGLSSDERRFLVQQANEQSEVSGA